MSTFSIPNITVQVGTRQFGPFAIPDADNGIEIDIDRTQSPHPLNGLTSATTYSVELQQSNDGGVTWKALGGASGIPGGTILTKTGATRVTDSVFTMFDPGTGRQLRCQVIVTGPSPITLSGTITST